MVETGGIRYGLDILPGRVVFARCSGSREEMNINRLEEVPTDEIRPGLVDRDGQIFFSIPEKEAIIKRVMIPDMPEIDPDKLAKFEMLASLIDDPEDFYLESFALNGPPYRLSVAYNRAAVDTRYAFVEKNLIRPAGYRLRSLALATGYMEFCRKESTDLVCLVDIGSEIVSYCFLDDNRIIWPGAMDRIEPSGGISAAGIDSFALDLVAVLKYRLALLAPGDRSAHLSQVVLAGPAADEELARRLGKSLSAEVTFPEILPHRLEGSSASVAARFLVSLGLTTGF